MPVAKSRIAQHQQSVAGEPAEHDRSESGRKFKPMVPVATCDEPTFSRNGIGIYGMSIVGHSGLMPANFTTLAHFSMSSAMNLPKPADELANAV